MAAESRHPLERCKLYSLLALPRCPAVNRPSVVEPIDSLGQSVRSCRPCYPQMAQCQLLPAARDTGTNVLLLSVRISNQAAIAFGLPGIQSLLQGV